MSPNETKIETDSSLGWIDSKFLKKSLEHFYADKKINVIGFDVAPATQKGENYASFIYRVNITFAECSIDAENRKSIITNRCNFIVKSAVQGGFADTLASLDVYDKEMEMYESVLPQLNGLLRDAGYDGQMFANTIYVSRAQNAILFEDLAAKDYRIQANKNGFDAAAARVILSQLAKFHALSAVLQEKQPNVFSNFKHGMFNRKSGALDTFYLTLLDALVETVAAWSDFQYYADKLRLFRSKLIERGQQAFEATPDQFNTLIHGDFWVNNIMLKHTADQKLDSATLIDFQFCCWTSPAIDLQYFFNTSLNEDLRLHHQDELLQHYHKMLTTTLKRLNYQKHVPTFDELRLQFVAKSFYGFTSACLVQPIQINEEVADADLDALLGTDQRAVNFKRLIFKTQRVQTTIRNLLPVFDKLKVFD